MAENTHYSILAFLYSHRFDLFIYLTTFVVSCHSYDDDSFLISRVTYPTSWLRPYDWYYIRVDLPTSFSSMTIALESDVNFDNDHVKQANIHNLPIICVREGSPPLPDAYNTSITNLVLDPISYESLGTQSPQFSEKCYPMQKNILLRLTNEQISPGVWYFGLFNGIGLERTQSKMINRGSGYSFSGNVIIEGCISPSISGQFCDQTVELISCVDEKSTQEQLVHCSNNYKSSCSGPNEPKVYTLDLFGFTEKITIYTTLVKVKVNHNQISHNTPNHGSIVLMCYVRLGAMPSASIHDYSGNIIDASLTIQSPKVGRWYITILPFDLSNGTMGNMKVCYSLTWYMSQCPQNKAGVSCTWERWERYTLQENSWMGPTYPLESYYVPVSNIGSSRYGYFLLEPLLSYKSLQPSQSQIQDFAWTYFVVNIPLAGGSLQVRINSDTKLNYEIYTLYGGLPLENKWDYFYVNSTNNSNGSMYFKLYDADEKNIGFYIIYARGGTWGFGIKHLTSSRESQSQSQTTMSISLEKCPRMCSYHGTCQNVVEMSGLSLYSYCHCDLTHGGFDCSVELVSNKGHKLQSFLLIASNAAFLFPAHRAFRQRAFAEVIIYTSSGISSGLYHACDVRTWCAISYNVLQFMDFWLSFLAIVSTLVYFVEINVALKRTILVVDAILTASMAGNGPTRSTNMVHVVAVGACSLMVGWLIEFFVALTRRFSRESITHVTWQTFKELFKKIRRRFRWLLTLVGFVALSMAAISWSLESAKSYWICHSMWHVCMYISAFIFLCSKVNAIESENQGSTRREHELTRQD